MIKYLIGNWKSNFILEDIKKYYDDFNTLLDQIDLKFKLILSVPYVWIYPSNIFKHNKLIISSQNFDIYPTGSYTSSVNIDMIKSLVSYSIIGHYECIKYFHEDEDIINKKLDLAINNNITPILCIGEPIEINKQNQTINYLIDKLEKLLINIDINKLNNLIIAYEPYWSIGSGIIPTNDFIFNVIEQIKKHFYSKYKINVDVLYGGSVNNDNIINFLKIENLDGFLIGNLSLRVNDFFDLIKKVNQ